MRTTPWRLLHAQTADQLYLAVEDRATHATAHHAEPLVAEFLAGDLLRPVVVIDLGNCGWLDEAFAGWLLAVQRRLAARGGRVVLSRCLPACREDLRLLGIDASLDYEDTCAPDGLKQTAITVPYRAERRTVETIAQGTAELVRRALTRAADVSLERSGAAYDSVT